MMVEGLGSLGSRQRRPRLGGSGAAAALAGDRPPDEPAGGRR